MRASPSLMRAAYAALVSTLFVAVGLAFMAHPARAVDGVAPDDAVRALLARMSRAMHELDYEGTFIYRRAEHVDTLQVFHHGSGVSEQERLVTLAGKPREIVRKGDDVQCILPDQHKILVGHQRRSKPFPSALFDNVEALFPYYRFELAGHERIAGRNTEIVSVLPRDAFRFGHRLWIDTDSGLLLRSDVLNENGEVIEQILFTNVEIAAHIDSAELTPSMDLSDFTRVPDPADDIDQAPPTWAGKLPAGYHLVNHKHRVVGADAVSVEHLLFSDGLSSVSVFIDAAPQRDDLLRGATHHGAANAYGFYHAGEHITVVGEVPMAAIEDIVAVLSPAAAAGNKSASQ